MFKNAILTTTSMTLVLAVAMPAYAQDDFEDEIIVTATKREQTLQEIPVAVTVTTAQTIEQAKISDVLDLQSVVPSLRVSQLQNSTAVNFIIRGFGNGANNPGIEPSVGVFIDGVYRSRSAAALSDLPNLERVEVLRGPQSTLFGKNASAGVISVVTAKPSYDTQGYVEGTVGNFNQRALKGYFSTGLGDSDVAAFSIGGSVNQRDGYYRNLELDTDQNERDRWGLRGQALFEPSDDISFRVIADYDRIEEVCCGVANIVAGPTADIITGGGSLIALNGAVAALGGPAGVLLTPEQLGGLGQNLVPNAPFAYEGFYDFDPENEVENQGVSLEIDYQVNENIKLKSITSLRKQDVFLDGDVDFTGARLVEQNVNTTQSEAFTQELRLDGTSGDLDWLFGGFYFNDDLQSDSDIRYGNDFRAFGDYNVWLLQAVPFVESGGTAAPPSALGVPINFLETLFGLLGAPVDPFAPGQGLQVGFDQQNTAFSLFGQVDYHLTDRITLTGGLAYVDDRKTVTSNSTSTDEFSNLALAGGFFGALTPLQFLPPFQDFPNAIEGNTTFDNQYTYTAKAAFDATDSINVYGSYSTGFKASTWNLSRDSRPTAEDFADLQSRGLAVTNLTSGTRFAGPEESTVIEVGVKAKLDKGYINVTAFDQKIEGFQSNVFVGTGFVLGNAGEQSSRGVELDALYRPIEGLSVGVSATYLDPEFDDFDDGLGPRGQIGLTGERPAGIHELSAVVAATYNFNLAGRDGYIRADYQHESDVQIVDAIDEVDVGEFANREQNLFNASAGIKINDQIGLQVWGRNITNNEFLTATFPSVAQAGSFSGYPNAPRTYGATIRYDFD